MSFCRLPSEGRWTGKGRCKKNLFERKNLAGGHGMRSLAMMTGGRCVIPWSFSFSVGATTQLSPGGKPQMQPLS